MRRVTVLEIIKRYTEGENSNLSCGGNIAFLDLQPGEKVLEQLKGGRINASNHQNSVHLLHELGLNGRSVLFEIISNRCGLPRLIRWRQSNLLPLS